MLMYYLNETEQIITFLFIWEVDLINPQNYLELTSVPHHPVKKLAIVSVD